MSRNVDAQETFGPVVPLSIWSSAEEHEEALTSQGVPNHQNILPQFSLKFNN